MPGIEPLAYHPPNTIPTQLVLKRSSVAFRSTKVVLASAFALEVPFCTVALVERQHLNLGVGQVLGVAPNPKIKVGRSTSQVRAPNPAGGLIKKSP